MSLILNYAGYIKQKLVYVLYNLQRQSPQSHAFISFFNVDREGDRLISAGSRFHNSDAR